MQISSRLFILAVDLRHVLLTFTELDASKLKTINRTEQIFNFFFIKNEHEIDNRPLASDY